MNCSLAAPVAALGHNLQNHLARLFTAIPCADNLDSLVLCLITGYLDLGTSLLAKVVDGATTGTDDQPAEC